MKSLKTRLVTFLAIALFVAVPMTAAAQSSGGGISALLGQVETQLIQLANSLGFSSSSTETNSESTLDASSLTASASSGDFVTNMQLETALDKMLEIMYKNDESLSDSFDDTDTTYKAGGGLKLSGGTFSLGSSAGVRQKLDLVFATDSDFDTALKSYDIALWGDSTTGGGGGPNGYWDDLEAEFGGARNIYDGGVGGEKSHEILDRFLNNPETHSYVTVIWSGHNNHQFPEQIKEDIAEMVAELNHDRYIVMSLSNGDDGKHSTGFDLTTYNNKLELNDDLSEIYSDNFLDIRKIMVDAYDPDNPQDVIDHNNDVVPDSLRSDAIHLSERGEDVVAEAVHDFIVENFQPDFGGVVTHTDLPKIFASPFVTGNVTPNKGFFSSLRVGTSTESDIKLDVDGDFRVGNSPDPSIYVSSTTATGTVGIGIADPLDFLHIKTNPDLREGGITLQAHTDNQPGVRFMNVAGDYKWSAGLRSGLGSNQNFTISNNTQGALHANAVLTILDGSNNVGIGTTAPQRKLHTVTSADEAPVRFEDANGYCEIDPTSTTWTCASDERLKDDISSLDNASILEKLSGLRPVNFIWKSDESAVERTGLIAQEVEGEFPSLVKTDESSGFKSVSYGGFIPYVISGLQELADKVADLGKRVKTVVVETRDVQAEKLCLEDVCITKNELKDLLEEQDDSGELMKSRDDEDADDAGDVAGTSTATSTDSDSGDDDDDSTASSTSATSTATTTDATDTATSSDPTTTASTTASTTDSSDVDDGKDEDDEEDEDEDDDIDAASTTATTTPEA